MPTLKEIMNRSNELEDNAEYMFAKGEIELIEKAVYADTAENRRLGRVGQEYHRGKGKKMEDSRHTVSGSNVNAKLKEKVNKIADLIEKNIDKFNDYKWSGDPEEAGITPEVAEAFDAILTGVKGIDVKQQSIDGHRVNNAENYRNKLKKQGYRVLDLDLGDDSYFIVGLKPNKD